MPKSLFIYKDDAQLVAELLAGNEGALHYVFYDHFNPLLKMNAYKAAGTKQVEYDDLVQELYLYLSNNDWEKLRKYNPERPFVNWFSVVSYRFFKDFCLCAAIIAVNAVPQLAPVLFVYDLCYPDMLALSFLVAASAKLTLSGFTLSHTSQHWLSFSIEA